MTSTSKSREICPIRVYLQTLPKRMLVKRCIWERERNVLLIKEHERKFRQTALELLDATASTISSRTLGRGSRWESYECA